MFSLVTFSRSGQRIPFLIVSKLSSLLLQQGQASCRVSTSVYHSLSLALLADVPVSFCGFLQREDVATQFGQMNLSRQSSGETAEPPAGPVYPPSLLPQPTQQPSYVITSTGQQLPTGGFSGSGPPISQQVLQPPPSPQGFVQQPPAAQVKVLFLRPVTETWFGCISVSM